MCKKSLILALFIAVMTAGCVSWQPSSYNRPTDDTLPWKNYDEAKVSADKIKAGETTFNDLKKLGFDPVKIPNTSKIVDVRKSLLPNPTSTVEELTEGAKICYKKGALCDGYKFYVRIINSEGMGNTMLRLMGIKKEVLTKGWEFELNVYLVSREDIEVLPPHDSRRKEKVVVYGLYGGTPNIASIDTQKNPLGLVNALFSLGSQFSPIRPPSLNTD